MTSDLLEVESIREMSTGRTVGNEPRFSFPEVGQVILLCTQHEIVVLGVELMLDRGGSYQTITISDYDFPMQDWHGYVVKNNSEAEEFVKMNAMQEPYFYLLTASSHKTFEYLERNRP